MVIEKEEIKTILKIRDELIFIYNDTGKTLKEKEYLNLDDSRKAYFLGMRSGLENVIGILNRELDMVGWYIGMKV